MDVRKNHETPSKADVSFKKKIGNTTYIVEYEFSPTARETAYEKLKRLIMSEAGLDYCPGRDNRRCAFA